MLGDANNVINVEIFRPALERKPNKLGVCKTAAVNFIDQVFPVGGNPIKAVAVCRPDCVVRVRLHLFPTFPTKVLPHLTVLAL